MSIRSFFRKLAGRVGKASRSTLGASSHIHTKQNKRATSKAYRRCDYGYLHDRTFYEDHHLDVQDPNGYGDMPNILPPCSAHSQQGEKDE